jgi:hypothetical protein
MKGGIDCVVLGFHMCPHLVSHLVLVIMQHTIMLDWMVNFYMLGFRYSTKSAQIIDFISSALLLKDPLMPVRTYTSFAAHHHHLRLSDQRVESPNVNPSSFCD